MPVALPVCFLRFPTGPPGKCRSDSLSYKAAAATFQLLVPSIHGYIQSRGDLTTPSSPLPTDPSHSLPSANKDPTQGLYLPGKKPLMRKKEEYVMRNSRFYLRN